MIRPLQSGDIENVCHIVNSNWKMVYADYVSPELLTERGCLERSNELKADFISGRLSEYVWEEEGNVLAMLSAGKTADVDKAGAYEVWRIYVSKEAQGRGIGNRLLSFAEQQARKAAFHEVLIWAFRDNIHAIFFYQKCGYTVEKEKYLGEPYLTYGIRLHKLL